MRSGIDANAYCTVTALKTDTCVHNGFKYVEDEAEDE